MPLSIATRFQAFHPYASADVADVADVEEAEEAEECEAVFLSKELIPRDLVTEHEGLSHFATPNHAPRATLKTEQGLISWAFSRRFCGNWLGSERIGRKPLVGSMKRS